MENDGDTPVTVRNINYPDNNCPTVLAAHAQCQIQVDGTYSNLLISTTTAQDSYTLPVSVPSSRVSVGVAYMGFGTVAIGGGSNIVSFTQPFNQNGQPNPFSVGPLPILNASDFPSVSCTPQDWREPCSVGLPFIPTAPGLRTALIATDPASGFYKAFGIGGDNSAGAAFCDHRE